MEETVSTVSTIWQKSKLLIKVLIIGFITILLLIPSFMVQGLIEEREQRQKEAFNEISSKWAGQQTVTGPVLVVPYNEGPVKSFAYFLPDQLQINGDVTTKKKYRGIYQVSLYSSAINMKGKFLPLPLYDIKLPAENMLWQEAYICMNISDARGLGEELKLKINEQEVILQPANINNAVFKDGFKTAILTGMDLQNGFSFSLNTNVNGSGQLLFTPVGKETMVTLKSQWKDPSFTGNQLPDTSDVSEKGFTAVWKSLSHSRAFPQAWRNDAFNLSSASFGADFFVPVNGYQKILRSVKYAILCIILTFTAFFLIETNNKRSVHPLQYALIGFALLLFYTLLLSFFEYTGFNIAYIIASVATIGLITWFVKGLLQSFRLSSILSFILVLLYLYIFTILQLQDYALLFGSIGLFLTLALVMYFSRKLKW